MPTVRVEVRLLRSPVDIPAGQWFLVHPNDTIEFVDADFAEGLIPKPSSIAGLTNGLESQLRWLAARTHPVSAGKHNASGQLSKLKALGYATNDSGKWSITSAGREALNVA